METASLLPIHWLQGYRTYVGARLISLVGSPSGRLRRTVLESAVQPSWPNDTKATLQSAPDLRRLECLPPAALHSLSSLKPSMLGENWSQSRAHWDRALNHIMHDGRISPVYGAKLIANRILDGGLAADHLSLLAQHELGVSWTGREALNALQKLSEGLSNRATSTIGRLLALNQFRKTSSLDRWPMVENAILQPSFAWPALILQAGSRQVELSLPVAVDIHLDGQARYLFSGKDIDYSRWERPLQNALAAAKSLWLWKHKSWPDDFKHLIENASVTIDLTAAEAMIQPYAEWARLALTGRSAEAYLALVILANILDRAAVDTVCATGLLGDPLLDSEGGSDFAILEPAHLELKVEGIRQAMFFDTVVVADPRRLVASKGHLRVCRGRTLSKFATHTFGQTWRKSRWLRCADLAHIFRPHDRNARYRNPRSKYANLKDPEVEWVLDTLQKNTRRAVFTFHRPIRAGSIARALYRITTNSASTHTDGRERFGSLACVRIAEDDTLQTFWPVLWNGIEGTRDSLREIQSAATPSLAASILSDQLNRFRPTAANPNRSPDILVIIGPRGQDSSTAPSLFLVELESLLHKAGKTLAKSPVSGIVEQVQTTRIILVHQHNSPRHDVIVPLEQIDQAVPSNTARTLQKLSIFRFGFSFQMARHILGRTEEECERLLQELARIRYPRNKVLSHAPNTGEYYARTRVAAPTSESEAADLHFAAANAIVGFLAPHDDATRFNYHEAFNPARLHEAFWHLTQAIRLGGPHHIACRAHDRLARVVKLESDYEHAKCA
jgi:hypothetical protein